MPYALPLMKCERGGGNRRLCPMRCNNDPVPMSSSEPDFFQHLRAELRGGRVWLDRAIVLGYAVLAGLFVVAFTMAAEHAFALFRRLYEWQPWLVLAWTPAWTVGIAWRRGATSRAPAAPAFRR